MSDLFLDQDFKPSFTKLAMAVKLSDNAENWQREVASEIFKQLPYLADYAVNVILDKVDAQRGYALGSAEVSNQTDAPLPDQPQQSVRIPIIVRDRLMQPLDVMIVEGQVWPLNERRLSEKLFRTEAFETSTRKPTDQGMVDQLYPPMRTNYGYGNSVATGAGVGGFGKQASAPLTEAIASTISDRQFNAVLEKVSADREIALMSARNEAFSSLLHKIAMVGPVPVEKTAEALVRSIRPTVVQLEKLASGKFKVKWANAGAFAPQEGMVDPGTASAMAGQDLSAMKPGQTMTVSTERAQKEALDEPAATPITEFGDYAVKNADTGETYVGTVLPVVDFEMQPLELFVFTDGAGHYGVQDSIVGIRQDGPGGMALQQQDEEEAAAAAPPMPQQPAGAPAAPAAPAPDAGMPKMAVSHTWIRDRVRRGVQGAAESRVHKFINKMNVQSVKSKSGLSIQKAREASRTADKHLGNRRIHEHMKKMAGAAPQGDGVFVYIPQGDAKPFCTQPLTVSAQTAGPDGSVQVMAEDVFGQQLVLHMTPGLISFEQVSEGEFAVPAELEWLPLQGEPVHLLKADQPDAAAEQKQLGGTVDIKSTGPDEVSLEGMPLAKVARDQKWFLKTAEAEFLLVGMGMTQDEARSVLDKARNTGHMKLAGLNPIRPLADVHAEMTKKAAELLKHYDYDFWTRDTVKIAAALEDSETADKILALNFLNPENLSVFASYLPQLDETSSKLAEMLMGARLGMSQVPEGACERALKNLEEVIQGLRALQTKQLI